MFKTLWFKTGVKNLWIYIDMYATDVSYPHMKIEESISWQILQILKEERYASKMVSLEKNQQIVYKNATY